MVTALKPGEKAPEEQAPVTGPSALTAIPTLRKEARAGFDRTVERAALVAASVRGPFGEIERRGAGDPMVGRWMNGETRELIEKLAAKKQPVEAVQFASV